MVNADIQTRREWAGFPYDLPTDLDDICVCTNKLRASLPW